ncbi:hypothetical protein TRIATDRAFT_83859 [Trichoderma atroviride IMI 206040]|uniref:FAD-binding PCMH-type domain-containing protein n=1 Tax=Hypocrea atroviridis (strain ATCC 20476 / IMI 206040) TaxID=452589 RepID=G9NES1_HYPAI|nr:uncharacterized protein TRIATDRAFT_83859 [Trichoderma atroviride IMI 206040]EHK50802.1 hypothetical protein TRIATDRAFT_83859 [Trichoderma atroviride IMI 206040]
MHLTKFMLLLGVPSALAKCKCTPTDDCWPSTFEWKSLNSTVQGQLIANEPLAKPCYAGFSNNFTQCQEISKLYQDASFREASPIGYMYPVLDTCVPINGSITGNPVCDLGSASVYSINASGAADVAAGVKFARDNNVRLVVKNTGHDIRARQGYGSLSIWMKHIKPELQFQETYSPSDSSCQSTWNGSAIVVGAGYIWDEVYAFAAEHGHIAVGGADRTVGAVGGYLQGGGHGFASHDFGLAADQVLEYQVVLATGDVVTASACQNVDLFSALRGGGGGTFGIVLAATLKVYPTQPVLKHSLSVTALSTDISALLNVSVTILSKYPTLLDAGFSGYGQLERILGQNPAYSHSFGKLLAIDGSSSNSSSEIERAESLVNEEILDFLSSLNGTGFSVTSTFQKYDTFQDYFNSGSHDSNASNNPSPAMVSRFFDNDSLSNNQQNLSSMLEAIFPQSASQVQAIASLLEFCLVGGGEVLSPQPHTAIHPGWRKTYMLAENFDVPPTDSGLQGVRQVKEYATSTKLKAMKDATPVLGTYLNEADPNDPDWKEAFYGNQYSWLNSVKQTYDPDGVFWCYRCVGYEGWEEITGPMLYGPLCQTNEVGDYS